MASDGSSIQVRMIWIMWRKIVIKRSSENVQILIGKYLPKIKIHHTMKTVTTIGKELEPVAHFIHITWEEYGWIRSFETEITIWVKAGWRCWKKCSDESTPVKLKGNVYITVIRPAMLYGAETWATMQRQETRIEVNEMTMLRWIADWQATIWSGTNACRGQRVAQW